MYDHVRICNYTLFKWGHIMINLLSQCLYTYIYLKCLGIWSAYQPGNSKVRQSSQFILSCLGQNKCDSTSHSDFAPLLSIRGKLFIIIPPPIWISPRLEKYLCEGASFFLTSAGLDSIILKQAKHRNCYTDPQLQRTEELSGLSLFLMAIPSYSWQNPVHVC